MIAEDDVGRQVEEEIARLQEQQDRHNAQRDAEEEHYELKASVARILGSDPSLAIGRLSVLRVEFEAAEPVIVVLVRRLAKEHLDEIGVKGAADLIRAAFKPTPKASGNGSRRASAAQASDITDMANSARLARHHGRDLRFCSGLGWLVWDGKRWVPDEIGMVMRLARDTVVRIFDEAKAATSKEEAGALATWAVKSQNLARMQAMVTLGESEEAMAIRPMGLDGDPWLLNLENGVLDLRTGIIRPHRREDLISKIAGTHFNPAAKAPTWDRFISRVTDGDRDLGSFLQQLAGYFLTASTQEQKWFLFVGPGANGKSVFCSTMLALLGDYGVQAAPDLLLLKRGETHPCDWADLAGARLAICTEAGQGRHLDEARIKQATGGDRMKARHMRQDFFEFEMQAKIVLGANHRPKVPSNDNGTWRRLNLVPWRVVIPAEEQDPNLAMKLRGELPGILNWNLAGLADWRRRGLVLPRTVMEATSSYRSEQDILGDFIAEKCSTVPDATVLSGELFRSYVTWCEATGVRRPMSQIDLGIALEEKGFERRRFGNARSRGWAGLGLKAADDADTERSFSG